MSKTFRNLLEANEKAAATRSAKFSANATYLTVQDANGLEILVISKILKISHEQFFTIIILFLLQQLIS